MWKFQDGSLKEANPSSVGSKTNTVKFHKIVQKQKFLRRAFHNTDGKICLNHNQMKRKRKIYVKDLNLKFKFCLLFCLQEIEYFDESRKISNL